MLQHQIFLILDQKNCQKTKLNVVNIEVPPLRTELQLVGLTFGRCNNGDRILNFFYLEENFVKNQIKAFKYFSR